MSPEWCWIDVKMFHVYKLPLKPIIRDKPLFSVYRGWRRERQNGSYKDGEL